VVINGKFSSWLPVTSGVPQGSILGPLLCLLYIDDLATVVHHSTIQLFADDVAIYNEVKSYEDCEKLQDDLNWIFLWTVKWQLRLNSQKCDAIMITRKRNPPTHTYCVNGSPITWKSIVRYLGVYINSTLNWTDHTAAKATRRLNLLCHSLWGCSSLVKSLVYKASVRPVLEYAAQVWNPYTRRNINAWEAVQHRAACWAARIPSQSSGQSHLMNASLCCNGQP